MAPDSIHREKFHFGPFAFHTPVAVAVVVVAAFFVRREKNRMNLYNTTQKFPALKNGFYASNKASANKTEEKF